MARIEPSTPYVPAPFPDDAHELPPGGVPRPDAWGDPVPIGQAAAHELDRQQAIVDNTTHTLLNAGDRIGTAAYTGLWKGTGGFVTEIGQRITDQIKLAVWVPRQFVDQTQQLAAKLPQFQAMRYGHVPDLHTKQRIDTPVMDSHLTRSLEANPADTWPKAAHRLAQATPLALGYLLRDTAVAAANGRPEAVLETATQLAAGAFMLKQLALDWAPTRSLASLSKMPLAPRVASSAEATFELALRSAALEEAALDASRWVEMREHFVGEAKRLGTSRADAELWADSAKELLVDHLGQTLDHVATRLDHQLTSFGSFLTSNHLMKTHGWSRPEFIAAVKLGDPRLAGTIFESPLAQNAVARQVLEVWVEGKLDRARPMLRKPLADGQPPTEISSNDNLYQRTDLTDGSDAVPTLQLRTEGSKPPTHISRNDNLYREVDLEDALEFNFRAADDVAVRLEGFARRMAEADQPELVAWARATRVQLMDFLKKYMSN
jgi:hypothetical protein